VAKVIVNCGIVPVHVDGQEDGVLTFGKHAGKRLSDPEVHWTYLAWAYAWLESHGLPDYLMPVLELVWYWGERKFEEEGDHGDDEKGFDEILDEARIRIDEGFEDDTKVREQTGWQLTYWYDEDQDEWVTITVAEKRKREGERAQAAVEAIVGEAVSGG